MTFKHLIMQLNILLTVTELWEYTCGAHASGGQVALIDLSLYLTKTKEVMTTGGD